jgi:hydrogenase maturation factor
MRSKVVLAVAAVAVVVASTAAFAVGRSLSGDSVRTHAVVVTEGETFTVPGADFDRVAVDIPGYSVRFPVSTPTFYRLTSHAIGHAVLVDASGCESQPPIGTLLVPRQLLKTPTGTVTPQDERLTPLTVTGTYTLAMKLPGNQSGLGAHD